MGDESTVAEELRHRIVENRLDGEYPGVHPHELTGLPYYDRKREDPEASIDKIVRDARSLRAELEWNLKHQWKQCGVCIVMRVITIQYMTTAHELL